MARKPTTKQFSFAGGEISPKLGGRTDLERYRQSLATCRNFIIEDTGAATNRPGFKFIGRTKVNSTKSRLIPFKATNDQSYALEFGEHPVDGSQGYMRAHTLSGTVRFRESQGGIHDGADSNTVLTDASASWVPNQWAGATVVDVEDSSTAIVVSNTETTVTCDGLSGGGDDLFQDGDDYTLDHLANEETGTHDGSDSNTVLTDAGAAWEVNQWIGSVAQDTTDGSHATIVSNTATTVTCDGLLGGLDNLFQSGDSYKLIHSAPLFEIATPFLEDDLAGLDYSQQNDVMFITHPSFHPQRLARFADDLWTIGEFSVAKDSLPPINLDIATPNTTPDPASPNNHPVAEWDWVVTSVDVNGQESIPSDPHQEAGVVVYPDQLFNELDWDPPTEGTAPVAYNIYRGRDGIYGYIGSTQGLTYVDRGNPPDYSDQPPTQRDPATETISVPGSGANEGGYFDVWQINLLNEQSFFTKSPAAEAFDDKYVIPVKISNNGAPPAYGGGTSTFEFRTSTDGSPPWTLRHTEVVTMPTVPETIYKNIEVVVDGLVATSEIRIELTAKTGNGAPRMEVNTEWEPFAPFGVTWNLSGVVEGTQDSFPALVSFHDQRLVFANYSHNAQLLRFSKTGDFFNFDQSTPLKEDDSFDLVLAAASLDQIKHLVPGTKLVALTGSGEWTVRGSEGIPLSPVSYDLKKPTSYGAGDAKALALANAIVYAADRGRTIREMIVDPYGTQSATRDLGVMVKHLFQDHTITELQYADVPFSVLWALRSDGALLGLTYLPEHQVWAWHRHDTGSVLDDDVTPVHEIESICAIPEDNESALYVIAKRTIDGETRRYVERMATRRFVDRNDAIFTDAAVSYDGRNTGSTQLRITTYQGFHTGGDDETDLEDDTKQWVPDEWIGDTLSNTSNSPSAGPITDNDQTTIQATMAGGPVDDLWDTGDGYSITPTWAAGKKLVLIADVGEFVNPDDVGLQFEVRRQIVDPPDENGISVVHDYSCRVLVSRFISDTILEVVPQTAVPTQLQSHWSTEWGRAHNSFATGVDHLEGETLAVLVDGASHAQVVVSAGEITLDGGVYGERVHVGIPYVSELITLPLDIPGDAGSLRMSSKTISSVGLELDQYNGVYVGHSRSKMTPAQQRAVSDGYETIDPENTLVVLRPTSSWKRLVNVIVQQRDPLPVTVLSLLVEFQAGGQ